MAEAAQHPRAVPAGPSTPFRRHPSRYFDDPDSASAAVVAHLDSTAGHFDLLSRRTDPARLTAADIVAVSMLGRPIAAETSAWLLGAEGQWLTTEILADVPADDSLFACEAASILRTADLFHLFRAATSQVPPSVDRPAMGQANATRLLAAKRPALAPVDDGEVRKALRYPKDALWFRRWRTAVDDDLLSKVRTTRRLAASERPDAADLSELRVLDIVVRRRSKTRRP